MKIFIWLKPSNRYKDSFIEALRDYKADKGFHIISVENAFDISGDNLEPFLQKAEDASKGEGLPEGWVPASQFWLINGEKYVGTVDVRHRLTPLLAEMGGHIAYEIAPAYRGKGYAKIALKLALAKALELGIDKPMVMCKPDNTRSKKMHRKGYE